MTIEEHEFFRAELKKLNTLKVVLNEVVSGISSFENKLVQYDLDAKSLDMQIKKKEEQLAGVEKMIRERRAMVDASTASLRDQLNKKHLELVERDTKLKIREAMIAEQQKKTDELLMAAESQAAKHSKVEPVVQAEEPMVEKRGPGRPAKSKVGAGV